VLRVNPQSRAARWGIARVYWHRKSPRAVRWARMAAFGSKGCQRMLYINNLALVYMKLGQYAKADRYFRVVRRMRCHHPGRKYTFLFNRVLLYQLWNKPHRWVTKVAQEALPVCYLLPKRDRDSRVWKSNCHLLKAILSIQKSSEPQASHCLLARRQR
jgi:hypothetical protein